MWLYETAIAFARLCLSGLETAIAFARLFLRGIETAVAFARECLRGIETDIAFAGTGRASNETGIAFAGENWVFLARFSLALVLSVSTDVVQGRALVMVVSRWPVLVVAEVSLVSPSPPQCVLCAKKFALRGLVVGVSAKKFALRGHNGPKLVSSGVLGELFRGWGVGGGVLGELFCACRPHGQALRGLRHLHIGNGGGFAALGAGCRRVAGVSHP